MSYEEEKVKEFDKVVSSIVCFSCGKIHCHTPEEKCELVNAGNLQLKEFLRSAIREAEIRAVREYDKRIKAKESAEIAVRHTFVNTFAFDKERIQALSELGITEEK